MSFPPSWNPGPGAQPGGDPWQSGHQLPGGADPFAHGQQPGQPWPGYGEAHPLGGRQPQGEPPRPDNIQWIIATIAAVLVVAVLVGGLLWKLNSGNETPQATTMTTSSTTSPSSTPTTTTTTATSTAAAPAPPSAPCDGVAAGPSAQTPAGWKTVVSPRGLAYDVPPDWEVLKCTTLVGWEKKCPETPDSPFGTCPIRTMSGAATLANPTCPDGNSLALSGAPGAKNVNDIREALRNETGTVKDIYTSDSGVVPTVDFSEPRDLTIGGAPAVEVIATVTGIEADQCTAPKSMHVMVATTVPRQQGTVLFVISMAQDHQGAPAAGLIDQMVGSLRLTS